MQAACRIAGPDGCNAEHILAALIEDVEGRPAVLLARAGVDVESLSDSLPKTQACSEPETRQFSPLLDDLADRAYELSKMTSGDRVVGTEHLLLAVLQLDSSLREKLEHQGLKFDQLHTAILGGSDKSLPLDEPLQLLGATVEIDLARVLDAAANRAREALRVMEDHCRFVLDDAFLTRRCKELRHELANALAGLTANWLLEARDTVHDVGTTISTPEEQQRTSVQGVIQANCKRLQESLRSLEEYGKLKDSRVGQTLEKLRYQSYTLERSLIHGGSARQRLADARLYALLSSTTCQAALDWTIREAAAGGVQIIQLREKNLPDRELLAKARQVRRWTREAGVLFIVNDRPDIARLAEADGVHVGQEDLPVRAARRIIGHDALIGVSTHNLEQVGQAVLDGASYIGVGPAFPSGTKEFAEFPGLEFARAAVAETSLPAFVLGGINPDNIQTVVAAGLNRVAVGEAIAQANDPRQVAKELHQALSRPDGRLGSL